MTFFGRAIVFPGSEQTICSKAGKQHHMGIIVIGITVLSILCLAENERGHTFLNMKKVGRAAVECFQRPTSDAPHSSMWISALPFMPSICFGCTKST